MKTLPILVALAAMLVRAGAEDPVADALAREREQQTGTAITILFDNSGSMRDDNKIVQAKAAFRAWLQNVPPDYKFSLITFEGKGNLVVPLGEHTRDIVAARVAKLEARTSTPICGSLRIAREQIEKRRREVTPYERHVVLIFTDGMENEDPRGIDGVREDILALRKMMVEVVGVGFHNEGDYMNGVATRFALANNEQELKQGLAKVDAEIGGTDDVVVSADELTALKTFQPPPPTQFLATATAATSAPASGVAPAPATKPGGNGFGLGWIIVVIVTVLLLRSLSSSKTGNR